tara:strand:- start:200 stop:910 length:711 start_codon:yes stop_codon:yes gene_type:complete
MKLINKVSNIFKKIAPYRIKTFYKKNFRKFNGVKKIDEKMLKYINYSNGYFIEMGAHDGVHNSNSLYFEKYKGWNGLLIEPSIYYNFLIKNRSKKNKFFNVGCSEFNGATETIFLETGDYSICKNLVDKNFFDWHLKKQYQAKKKILETKIKLRTLNSILIESNAPKIIDFFSLDVEGMEMKVLEGVDFAYFNFKYLLVECNDTNKFEKVFKYLTKKNYTHIDNLTPWDCLFKFKQ